MFRGATTGFLLRFGGEARVYDLPNQQARDGLQAALEAYRPDLVFCLGNSAAAFAKAYVHDRPVLFALVPDAADMQLTALPNFFGIAMEPPAPMEFAQFRMVLPKLARVLTFYHSQTIKEMLDAAAPALQASGVTITSIAVTDPNSLRSALSEHVDAHDAVWMLADKAVVNQAAFDLLLETTNAHHKPLITSVSHTFAQAGAFMSASVNLTSIGGQSALLARRVLVDGSKPQSLGMQAPIGVRLSVNLATAAKLGLVVDPRIIPYIDRIFRS